MSKERREGVPGEEGEGGVSRERSYKGRGRGVRKGRSVRLWD